MRSPAAGGGSSRMSVTRAPGGVFWRRSPTGATPECPQNQRAFLAGGTTMKLYVKPGACSLSPHIVLRELGLPFDLERGDTKAAKPAAGQDFRSISPKGYVPALQLDDGAALTERVAIAQYLADRTPQPHLAPTPTPFQPPN